MFFWGAFAAGVIGSLGPCTPLRLGTAAWLVGVEWRRQALLLALFILGTMVAAAAIVLALKELLSALRISPLLYLVAALAFLYYGVRLLLDVGPPACKHDDKRHIGASAAFLLGFGQAVLVQPCCAAGLLWLIAQTTSRSAGMMLVACICYGLGQSASLLLAPLALWVGPRMQRVLASGPWSGPWRVSSQSLRLPLTWALGTFCLMAGIFYAIQA